MCTLLRGLIAIVTNSCTTIALLPDDRSCLLDRARLCEWCGRLATLSTAVDITLYMQRAEHDAFFDVMTAQHEEDKEDKEDEEDKEDDKVAVLAQDFGIEAAAEAVAIVLAARADAARPTVAVDELSTGPLAELARL